jgi:hypothetical protein
MNVKKRKVEDMRRNLIVAATLLLAACSAQPPTRPADIRVNRKSGVQPLGSFAGTVQANGRGLHAQIVDFPDAGDGTPGKNPVDTLEIFSNDPFSETVGNNFGFCNGETTIGAPVTLKNYTLDELRNVHVEITLVGSASEACSAVVNPPDGSPAPGGLGFYIYPDLSPAIASGIDGEALNNSTGQAIQWDFFDRTPGTPFVVKGVVYGERWPPMPVMIDPVQDVLTSTPTFHWTSDASVTRTRLVVYDGTCTTEQNRYDVDRTSTDGTSSFYSVAAALAQETFACADLFPVGYPSTAGQFVGTQFDREVLYNYNPPVAGLPASGAIISKSFTFTWAASPDAASVTAYVCAGSTATAAACVSTGTAFQFFGDGSGSYSSLLPGLTAGLHNWTLVASDYLNAPGGVMTGTPTALKSFTVQ